MAEFTVLITVYKSDNAFIFDNALASIFNNTIKPKCVLLIVDGEVPESIFEIIDFYIKNNDLSVKYLSKNLGLANALNYGLNFVNTDWVVRADADDINLPNRFATLFDYMNSDYDLIGSSVQEVDENNNKLKLRKPPESMEDIRNFSKRRNPFNHMSVCFRVDLVKAVGGYPNIYLREDYALWARLISCNAKCYNIQQPLVNATAGNNMYKRRGGIKYAFGEFQLQKHLVDCGLKSPFAAFFDGISRAMVFLLPIKIRAYIYKSFLRA